MHMGVGISQNKRGKQVTESVVSNAYGSHCSEGSPRTDLMQYRRSRLCHLINGDGDPSNN